MLTLRRSNERGKADHGWLRSFHTFSFAGYYDDAHMHFRTLRVINEDYVAGGEGFPTHPPPDMEIIPHIVDGALEHKDSMGNGAVIYPGEIQRMTAGTGVTHSEYNHLKADDTHLLQIWILPEARNLKPGYEQKFFADDEKRGKLRLVGSRDGRDGSVTIHQDVALYASMLAPGETVTHTLESGRGAWLQLVKGNLTVNGTPLNPGDAAAIENEPTITITASQDAEFLLFDLA